MPLHEYECDTCGHRFERIQKFSDPPVEMCPLDQGPVKKLLSSSAIQFKGSGWYITDYAKKQTDDSKPAGGKESTTESTAADSASTSTKDSASAAPAAKSESKESKKESKKE